MSVLWAVLMAVGVVAVGFAGGYLLAAWRFREAEEVRTFPERVADRLAAELLSQGHPLVSVDVVVNRDSFDVSGRTA